MLALAFKLSILLPGVCARYNVNALYSQHVEALAAVGGLQR